ncbi:pilus assembly protein [Youhaiella tibetensis]|uniref:Type II secretion system F family protein n=1 Tax=Paradevosia tibetensis TaxID=1447062 RepID=A0A5B9DJ98_9HYPH|nr:type II secretion system F family protein [Youhaiella tibetensis]QEE18749.1 type II secretion system F family protein [Youhaiella tibetensis]GGF39568.1 pilus assembly protein [Youhaiella tibetensis]
MNPIILVILAMVSIGTLVFALVPSMLGSSRAEKRRKALQGNIQANRREAFAERNRADRRKQVQAAIKGQTDALNERKKRVPLKAQLYQAGMKIKPAGFIRNSVILGVAVFLVTLVMQVPLIFAAVFGIASGYLLPKLYMGRRRNGFRNKFLDELPNAVEAIVRGVKSGLPLNDSMRVVARESKEPLKTEFQRVLDQQAVGKTMSEAIVTLYDRVPVPEVNFFIVVITVQQQAGGNLSEALTNLSRVLRNRKKMKAKVKAMSSEAKASAGIIGSLPFVVAILVSLTSPTYLGPFFTTTIGMFWLGVAGLMLSMGVFVMYRMVQFEF